MRIKICGLFREEDIDFVNEARPDYIGFVFAESKRKITPVFAQYLRFRLASSIIPVGVFVNARIADITTLYQNGIISIAQLHGDEDESYIQALKKASGNKQIPIIKVINKEQLTKNKEQRTKKKSGLKVLEDSWLELFQTSSADYLLIDSGAGSGKSFNWDSLKSVKFHKPWFLAGGIDINNIEKAKAFNPFAIDVSSGAETDGIKNREKIIQLVTSVR